MIKDVADGKEITSTRSFAAYNKNEKIRLKSSSGGLFYTFAKRVLASGGIVFGACFDEKGQLFHKGCTTVSELFELMQSKYVQSDLKNCYEQVKNELLNRRIVLFCGTPCQIYGLLSYLDLTITDKDFKMRLITIDFICHGVPSRLIWRKYLAEISKGKNIKHINFRDKINGWRDYSLKIDYTDGSVYLRSWLKDAYMQGFIKNLYLRQSCYDCKFRGIERLSDFTIADFWGVHKLLPDFFDDKGTSILMVHNDQAMGILNSVKNEFEICEITNELVATTNILAVKSVPWNTNRVMFFKSLNEKTRLSKAILKAVKVSTFNRLKRRVMRIFNH